MTASEDHGGDGGGEGVGTAAGRAADHGTSRSLIATMVHDLRNPLAALAGNLAILREELAGLAIGATGQRCLEDALALSDRVAAMVQSIADVDAAEQGRIAVRPAVTALRPEIEQAAALARVAASARELTIAIDVEPDAVAIVDGRLLSRVVQNLVDNAVRYAPRRGRVVVKAELDGQGLTLWVGNSGPALTNSQRVAVFERDYRAAEREASARLGRDFGLHFCRLVVEAHGGTITVEDRPDLPAVFVVRIPGGRAGAVPSAR